MVTAGSLLLTTFHPLLACLDHGLPTPRWMMLSTHTTEHHNNQSVDPTPELILVVDSQHHDNDSKKSNDGPNNCTDIACTQPRLGCRRWSRNWCVIVGVLMVEEVVLETTSLLVLKVPPPQQELSNALQQYWVPPHEDTGAKPPTLDSTIV